MRWWVSPHSKGPSIYLTPRHTIGLPSNRIDPSTTYKTQRPREGGNQGTDLLVGEGRPDVVVLGHHRLVRPQDDLGAVLIHLL